MSSDIVLERDGRSARAEATRDRRRRELLDVALKVFSERGYHETRIADLIEAAGVARGTFYLYFESKNAIFHALLDELVARIRASIVGVELGEGALPLRDQLIATIERVLAVFDASPDLTSFVLRVAVGIDPEIDKKLGELYARLHDFITMSLDNGVGLGLVRAMDTRIVGWAVLGSIKQIVEVLVDGGTSGPRSGPDPIVSAASGGTPADRERDLHAMAASLVDYNLAGLLASR
jgi:AcrR family transcriptional regulator